MGGVSRQTGSKRNKRRMTIKAITFDLWDTLVHDDSDEPKRAAKGLRSKREERRFLVWEALNEAGSVAKEQVELAYDTADAAFNLVWKELHINWTVEQRLRVILKGLGQGLSDARFRQLVDATGRMEVEIPPDLIAGVPEALEALSRRYKLAIVSDAIVTPGSGLRAILEGHGIKRYFSGFAFSDEVGYSKPHRAMFETAAQALGVELNQIVHIGDRESNDIKGPHAIGAKGVLFTGSRAEEKEGSTADAICEHHRELPEIIDRLAGGPT